MEKYIVGAVIIAVIVLPSVLRIIYRAHRRAESAQEVLSKPFVCPNCGHRFYFEGKGARIIGEDKAILTCPNCNKRDVCTRPYDYDL